VDEAAWRFRASGLPYDWIRVRSLGGRSLLWGGWCERMEEQNFRDAASLDASWPVTLAELQPYYRTAERLLCVRTGRLSSHIRQLTQKLGLAVAPKRGAILPARTRVLCGLDLPRPTMLRSNCVALRLILDEGRIRGVEVVDTRSHRRQTLDASTAVLCASPIETARLLLASGVHGESGRCGEGLVDHLVATCIAVLPCAAPSRGPPGPLEQSGLVRRFVNIGRRRRRDYRSGFTVEVQGPIALKELGAAGIEGLGIDARDARQLSYFLVNAIGEAYPHKRRSVTLHANEYDTLGRPVPVVRLAWSKEQKAMSIDMEETVAAIGDALTPPRSRIIRLRDALRPGGIAHEAGTARMGKNPGEGVTDSYGAVFGVKGLYIADASVMPTALDRHPTLTIIALALRTADRIVADGRQTF
jgi:choline dehydrogenase-like flavoprotein